MKDMKERENLRRRNWHIGDHQSGLIVDRSSFLALIQNRRRLAAVIQSCRCAIRRLLGECLWGHGDQMEPRSSHRGGNRSDERHWSWNETKESVRVKP
ncbi:hypothetical protein K0M31_002339 [Melipona bicolor]|uniref:Uncharacterized protein n=1 Tax=Melipona bicolor TaxID=60889 RepID=A0AA40GI11_9HYME|nr:hypothetical protein K0M31_002339 [Melipona bicolor]